MGTDLFPLGLCAEFLANVNGPARLPLRDQTTAPYLRINRDAFYGLGSVVPLGGAPSAVFLGRSSAAEGFCPLGVGYARRV